MFRPQIQKTRILFTIAVFSLILVVWSSNTTVIHKAIGYSEKIKAAKIMESCLKVLKKEIKNRGITIYKDIDPNTTGLIFKEDSPLRTGPGDLESKQTTLKPNFAALIVDHMVRADIKSGDTIAIGMTGSMPGANIAVLSACKAMNVYPVIISSVGASMWGATDPSFTWIDMENALFNSGKISVKSSAASLGGRGDCLRENGRFGGQDGRNLVIAAIRRNNIKMVNFLTPISRKNLSNSITIRDSIYKNAKGSLSAYDAYINVGGGVASIGVGGKEKMRNSGYISHETIMKYDLRDSMVKRFAKSGVPIIHILNIPYLVEGSIPFGSEKSKTGEGRLFKEERYNLLVTAFSLFLVLSVVVFIGIYSHSQIKKQMQSYEPESIL